MAWYFAYGSNLDVERLKKRVGNWTRTWRAKLENYQLMFARGYEGHEYGRADIFYSPRSTVYGAVFDLTDEQMTILDKYEAVDKGVYKRFPVPVKVNKELIKAITYVMVKRIEEMPPDNEYLNCIVNGLKRFGYPDEIIKEVKRIAERSGGDKEATRIEKEIAEERKKILGKLVETGKSYKSEQAVRDDIGALRTILTGLMKDPPTKNQLESLYIKRGKNGEIKEKNPRKLFDAVRDRLENFDDYATNKPKDPIFQGIRRIERNPNTDANAFEAIKIFQRYWRTHDREGGPQRIEETRVRDKRIRQPRPPEPEPRPRPRGRFMFIVDSWPKQEVNIPVEYEIVGHGKEITTKEIEDILGKLAERALVPRGQTYLDLVLNNVITAFNGALPFADEKDARAWVHNRMAGIGLTNPDIIRRIADLLIERYMRTSLIDLDTLNGINRIGLRRPPGYLVAQPSERYLTGEHAPTIDRNLYTPYYLDTVEGWYRFDAPESKKLEDGSDAKFVRWEICREHVVGPIDDIPLGQRYIQLTRTGVIHDYNNVLRICLDENIRITAIYAAKGSAHTDRARIRSPYQQGTAGRFGGAKDTALGVLHRGILQKQERGIKKEIGLAQIGEKSKYASPAIRAAANKGKRILNKYGKAEYSRVFVPMLARFADRRADLQQAAQQARAAARVLRGFIRQNSGGLRSITTAGLTHMDLLNQSAQMMEPGQALVGNLAAQNARDALQTYMNKHDAYERGFEKEMETSSAQLESHLKERAETVAIGLARRFKIPLNSDDETTLSAELKSYATELAEDFATRGRTIGHAAIRGLRNLSRGMQTTGDVWNNFLRNLWNIITGPWTIGAIFVLIQFFFISTYIGYNPLLLFWIPIAGAILTFILNFEGSKQPLDWVGHLFAGAMMSFAFIIIFYALGITMETMGGGAGFFIFGGIIFVLIGLFQFYQLGGFRQAVMFTLVALVFGYVALGPYSGYWQVIKDQIKAPLNTAWRAIKGAVEDVFLLATNPTEWYARQQLVNVRPEKPLDFPKGIEVGLFDAMPPSVPGGQEFAVTAMFKNEGELKASNIKVTAECNQWCDTRYMESDSNFKKDGNYFVYGKDYLDRKEADTITLSHLVAGVVGQREAEFRMAKVKLKISYRYFTSASLLVDVMSNDEMQRLFREGKDVYHNVLAVEKVTPAKLSLNVGPQPLKAGTDNALLLLSISNIRDDGEIKLHPGDPITITLPKSIGSNLNCGGQSPRVEDTKEVLEYRVPSEITIKAYDFSSIFAILCSFNVKSSITSPVVTDLITAELGSKDVPGYEFIVYKEKDVPITPPLGIFFDPFSRVCAGCGKGAGTCDAATCHEITIDTATKLNGKCWFDSTKQDLISKIFKDPCRSCGLATDQTGKCVQFLKEDDCIKESEHCGIPCKWHPLKPGETIPVSAGGANIDIYKGWCESAAVTLGTCKDISSTYTQKYNQYKEIIEAAITRHGLRAYSSINPNALVAAIITQESNWDEKANGDGGKSFGLMQIYISAHPECDIEKIKAYDNNAIIDCGVGYLAKIIKENNIESPKLYACQNIYYSEIRAILRYYNGWSDDCSGTKDYVEQVYEGSGVTTKGTNYKGYLSWLDCFEHGGTTQTGTTTTKPATRGGVSGKTIGEVGFCGSGANEKCTEGGGEAQSDDECQSGFVVAFGGGIQLCCQTRTITKQCVNAMISNYGSYLPLGHRAYCDLKEYVSSSESEQCKHAEGDCDHPIDYVTEDECDNSGVGSEKLDCVSFSDLDADICCKTGEGPDYTDCRNAYMKQFAAQTPYKAGTGATTNTVGSADYCKNYRQSNCEFGEGLCNSNSECNEICEIHELLSSGETKNYGLECRPTTVGNLCCFKVRTEKGETQQQSDNSCLQRYNEIKNGKIPICGP